MRFASSLRFCSHCANKSRQAPAGSFKGGSAITDPGWSQNRAVNTEDIEATIYSALGINWTSVCFNDPFHRGFEYVPQSNGPNYWVPIDELFAT